VKNIIKMHYYKDGWKRKITLELDNVAMDSEVGQVSREHFSHVF